MYRLAFIALLFTLVSCSESTSPDPSVTNGDLLPLGEGNRWSYARVKYVRGSAVESDTLRLTVIAKAAENEFYLERASQYSIDTLLVRRNDADHYDLYDGASYVPFIDRRMSDPFAGLLIATGDIIPNLRSYTSITDTTYSSQDAPRVHEQVNLLDNDGKVILHLGFDHVFVPGIGQVALRFVADITECLRCSLISEFWVYELTSYNVQ